MVGLVVPEVIPRPLSSDSVLAPSMVMAVSASPPVSTRCPVLSIEAVIGIESAVIAVLMASRIWVAVSPPVKLTSVPLIRSVLLAGAVYAGVDVRSVEPVSTAAASPSSAAPCPCTVAGADDEIGLAQK